MDDLVCVVALFDMEQDDGRVNIFKHDKIVLRPVWLRAVSFGLYVIPINGSIPGVSNNQSITTSGTLGNQPSWLGRNRPQGAPPNTNLRPHSYDQPERTIGELSGLLAISFKCSSVL
eukprot:1323331-Amorphochlora_amoeboformis.AAC.1